MWKIVLLVLAVFILGHFMVRYVRKNPLDPVIEGGQVVVESQDEEVRFTRNGAVEGRYFIVDAASEDWTRSPVNLKVMVIDADNALGYMRDYPDFHLYGSESGARLANIAVPIALIAANRGTYGTLFGLVQDDDARAVGGGERLCLRVSGEALSVASAESLEDGRDETDDLSRRIGQEPIIYVESADVDDCRDWLAPKR
ncbi:MAG: hypothetical protein ACHQ6T_03890 [Myxococcota bacterium]